MARVKFTYIFLSILIFGNIALCAKTVDAGLIRNIYHDGLYDAYSQIENSIEVGIIEKKINMFKNKYIVYKNIEDIPFVDILLLRTIATKNNLDKTLIVKDRETNKRFIIFGGYLRKADATFIAKRLKEDGVSTLIKLNQTVYENDPVIAKKFLNDIKNMLADMPIKVIEVDRIIYVPRKSVQAKRLQTIKNENIHESVASKQQNTKTKYKNKEHSKDVYLEYSKVRNNILSKRYKVLLLEKEIIIPEKNNLAIREGEKIGKNLKLLQIKKVKDKKIKIVLRGSNGYAYVIYLSNTSAITHKTKNTVVKAISNMDIKPRANKDVVTNTTTAEAKPNLKTKSEKTKVVSASTGNKNLFICDFDRLETFAYSLYPSYRANYKKITSLPYRKKTKITLFGEEKQKDGTFVKIGGGNTKTFYIRKIEFKHACKNEKGE